MANGSSMPMRTIVRKKHLPLYMLMLPGMLYLLIYRYVPMGGLIMVFKNFRITRGIFGSEWNGFQNFIQLFSVPTFPQILKNTVEISLLKLVFGFPAPIVLALMLNELRCIALKRSLQTVLYLPHFISWVVCGTLIFTFFGPAMVRRGTQPDDETCQFSWVIGCVGYLERNRLGIDYLPSRTYKYR